jgi:ABC-2 type transport system permease protein
VIGFFWYGFWTAISFAAARIAADPGSLNLVRAALPGALLIVLLYWQVVPLLMAATGASLELRKLQAYPIPVSQLFSIEVLLRLTAGIEMAMVLAGIAIGVVSNPELPRWAALAVIPYVLFNLFLAVGLRDLLLRMMARKRFREIVVFLLVMCTAVPQLMLTRGGNVHAFRFLAKDSWVGWPWSATSNLIQGVAAPASLGILALWVLIAAVFGHSQFVRTLAFDKEAAGAGTVPSTARDGVREMFFRLPSALLRDPLGALVEKEVRMLVRSPRFRLVFLMGFTFGLVILLPVSLGKGSWFGNDYLTGVSVYSMLLLSEACFWNSFGFDRSAAQVYFLAPIPFARVLIGKNLSAVFFIALEIAAVTAVCGLIQMPLSIQKIGEAYAVAGVVTLFLLCAGNLLSVHQARGVNPGTQIRTSAAGRLQAMLVVIYPVAFIPVGLAYLARHVFESEWAFFGVLAFDAAAGFVAYRIALESAAEAAERLKERMIASLSAGVGPIAS